jgi:hypothetical protein
MSNKTLLNEGTVRRFMKLAEIGSLANPFVDRLSEEEDVTEDVTEAAEDVTEAPEGEELEVGADLGMEEPTDDMEEPVDDMEMDDMGMDDMDMEDEASDDPKTELSAGIAAAVSDAVSEYLEGAMADGTLEITQGEDADEVDLEADAADMEAEAEVEGEDEGEEVADAAEEDDAIVAEVARRVTKRILSSR